MIKGIHHVSMKCATGEELARVRDFYVRVLGMGICREWDEGIMFDAGNGCIEVFSNGAGERRKGAIRHVALQTDDVDGLCDSIRQAGYEVFIEPNDRTIPSRPEYPFRMAFCRGPLGEEIELFCELEPPSSDPTATGMAQLAVRAIDQTSRQQEDDFLRQRWYTLRMVVHGESIDLGTAEGLVATAAGEVVGLLTYRIQGDELEVLSLDSTREGRGIGTMLLDEAARVAREGGCSRVTLVTTNDNVAALAFYQRRGFDMVGIRRDAVDEARRIKPEIPRISEDGIPIRHEIELAMPL